MADTFGKLGKVIKKLGEKAQGILRNPDLDKMKADVNETRAKIEEENKAGQKREIKRERN